jgi:hypothetical protein
LGKILEALAPLHAGGDLPIAALVAAHAQHMPRGSTAIIVTPSVDQEVALVADLLSQRGLRPVIVLLDAATFGGPSGTRSLADAVTAFGVPVCEVKNGDDLAAALSLELDITVRTGPVLSHAQVTRRMVRS